MRPASRVRRLRPRALPARPTGTTAGTGITGASAPAGPTTATGSSGPIDEPTPVEPDPDDAACQLLTEDVAEPIIGLDLSVAGDVSIRNHGTCVLRDADETVSVEPRITLGRDAQREYDELYARSKERAGSGSSTVSATKRSRPSRRMTRTSW
jgi:hypothetical protein